MVLSTWTEKYSTAVPYIHCDFHTGSFLRTPNNSLNIIFGTDGGLSVSQDGGKSWNRGLNKGLTVSLINFITGSPLSYMAGILAVGLQDQGTKLRAYSNNVLWNEVFGGDGAGCVFNQVPLTSTPGTTLLIARYQNNMFSCLNLTGPGVVEVLNSDCTMGIDPSDSKQFLLM